MNRNRIQISEHFWLHEFEMHEGTVLVHTLGFHYVSNTLGSASITSK